MLNNDCYIAILETICVQKNYSGYFKNIIDKMCLNRIWHWITNNSWYAIKPNQTKPLHTHTYTHIYIYIYKLTLIQQKTLAQSAGAIEYTDCTSAQWGKTPTPNECPEYDTKWRGSSDGGDLGNAEHSFIAIAPRSTLARNGSTW